MKQLRTINLLPLTLTFLVLASIGLAPATWAEDA